MEESSWRWLAIQSKYGSASVRVHVGKRHWACTYMSSAYSIQKEFCHFILSVKLSLTHTQVCLSLRGSFDVSSDLNWKLTVDNFGEALLQNNELELTVAIRKQDFGIYFIIYEQTIPGWKSQPWSNYSDLRMDFWWKRCICTFFSWVD